MLAFVAHICSNSQICYNNSDCNINIAASLRIRLRNKLLDFRLSENVLDCSASDRSIIDVSNK